MYGKRSQRAKSHYGFYDSILKVLDAFWIFRAQNINIISDGVKIAHWNEGKTKRGQTTAVKINSNIFAPFRLNKYDTVLEKEIQIFYGQFFIVRRNFTIDTHRQSQSFDFISA